MPQYYTGSDGRGTVDDISGRLREGCPSYFKESDYKFFLAVERLERAALTSDAEEKENVAREAFSFLSKVPGSADLRTVCKRFEDLRLVFHLSRCLHTWVVVCDRWSINHLVLFLVIFVFKLLFLVAVKEKLNPLAF